MLPRKTLLFAMIFATAGLSACRSAQATPTALFDSTEATASTPTPSSSQSVIPSPTDIQLPFDPTVRSDDYCKPPYAAMSVAENDDISEEQIIHELMKIWLRRYASPEAPAFCRIDGFAIDKVYYDPDVLNQPLQPRGDFMRVVDFSIKLIQVPNAWMSFAGEIDHDNWLHVSQVAAVTATGDGYEMQFAYP
jgi:hypothetical protein